MNIIQVFGIILITSALCFIIFQLWYYYENYDYIIKYNDAYGNLEYSQSANINYQDSTVYDPNDTEYDVNKKWRCALNNSIYYPVSEFGFMSTDSTKIGLTYTYLNDCLLNLFDTQVKIIYNPCSVSNTSNDCVLLNNLLNGV
ncbi:ORF MSV132 putative Amsacta moorei entomopoxvirus G4R homolog (vaccinia A28L), similar to SW:P29816 [Melanoplus sanguinipes entomopoxvirus]|uniref:ORF MSV132 putative Amsacta moorei entomopoxvirus G4R homolog (Vaccinia A28L), similar to SW:P29816 n=1 Tax=Melanoplus sanguinipes entomopoxvirus TaxID=83191 RepID=Q9YVW0_MSEPV|nr:ORF MSV132 putative Amsacta moorei entomopoxvirus G4R homolog (vaccinia A28L), similar to SW:P29816 [Melanoplus sanguinipes entomopoxvirus]AAC97666.1 ORF MSV132 putative Amsacta moorei entomopoxvirus G4R homolog (vaccinia A28L), similar to SW:P29816 [Melanoplus sanguinipes entomopoxvirus 'O']